MLRAKLITPGFAGFLGCVAVLLFAAPVASAASNITVVAGNGLVNNSGAPSFTPTGPDSQVGADLINAQLQADTDVTLNTSSASAQAGTITINAAITAAGHSSDLKLLAGSTVTQTAAVNARLVTIAASGNVSLGALTANNLELTAGPGDVTQTAAVTVPGLADFAANTQHDVTMTNAGNDFGSVSVSPGGTVADFSVTDANALNLAGGLNTNGLLNVTAGGAVTQSGPIATSGPATFDVGATHDLTVNNPGNQFPSVSITHAKNASVADADSIQFLASTVAGNLSVSNAGAITQAEPISVAGTTTLAPGAANNISLGDGSNDFGTVGITSANNVTLGDANGLNLGASAVSGNLSVTGSGPLTQSGAVSAAGSTTLATGAAENITLNNASNDFATAGITSGFDVTLTDANALNLGASHVTHNLSVTSSGALTQSGAVSAVGTITLAAGAANDITLNNASNDFATVGISSGKDVSLTDANAINFGASTVAGSLSVTASGAIIQTNPVSVAGTTTLAAGAANNINLPVPSNDFATVGITSGKSVALTDANALNLGTSTVSGLLLVSSSGALTQSGAVSVAGATTLAAGAANDITLSNASNDFATVGVTSGKNVALTDANSLGLAASAAAGNLSATAGDDLSVGGGTSVTAAAALTLVSDNQNPSSPAIGTGGISVGSGASLSGAGAIRLYGAHRSDNSIDPTATFNGSTFTPGPLFAPSPKEQWGVYSPGGTAAAPFTFFYKDNGTPADGGKPCGAVSTDATNFAPRHRGGSARSGRPTRPGVRARVTASGPSDVTVTARLRVGGKTVNLGTISKSVTTFKKLRIPVPTHKLGLNRGDKVKLLLHAVTKPLAAATCVPDVRDFTIKTKIVNIPRSLADR